MTMPHLMNCAHMPDGWCLDCVVAEHAASAAREAALRESWAEADAVALAHRAGFAGTQWSMGPEELVHLLNLAAHHSPPASQPTVPAIVDHELKCWPGPFSEVAAGVKTAEFRRNDRGFRPGDWLLLREWLPDSETYTGRSLLRQVSAMTSGFGIPEGFVMLSLAQAEPRREPAPKPRKLSMSMFASSADYEAALAAQPPASQQEAEPTWDQAQAAQSPIARWQAERLRTKPPEADAPPKPADWTKPMGLTMDPNAPPLGFAAAPAPQAADAGVTDKLIEGLMAVAELCADGNYSFEFDRAAIESSFRSVLSRTASSADGAGGA